MNRFYCANCGKQLSITRKALPKFGTIVDLVQYHECSEEPIPFEIDPTEIVKFVPVEGKDKFVNKLNELKPPGFPVGIGPEIGNLPRRSSMTGTDDLRDRRFEHGQDDVVKSTAPVNVLDQIRGMHPSAPAHELKSEDEPGGTDSEMEG